MNPGASRQMGALSRDLVSKIGNPGRENTLDDGSVAEFGDGM